MTLTSKLAKDRTAAFIAKAERLLRWGAKTQSELIGYGQCGDLDEFERIIFVLLALLSSAHEALAAAATVAGEEAWLKEFSDRREKDRLLRYLWKARDADIHDAIVKWTPNFQELRIRVTDAGKAHAVSRQFRLHATQGEDLERLFHFVYEVSSHTELIAKLD